MKIELKTGILELENNIELEKLIGFGSRINKKRGFLFVSKVLGKHIPVKPYIMQNLYKKLSLLIPKSNEKTLFIGFAETATALGQGVFENANLKDSFYMHSTRVQTSKDVLLKFYEEHCHAPTHIFYKPDIDLKSFSRIILIDDEVSTGNTANNLVKELKYILPNIKTYYLLTILNWTKEKYIDFEYLSLYKSSFNFYPKNLENIKIDIISERENSQTLDNIIPFHYARYGTKILKLNFSKKVDIKKLIGKKVLVLGTGEFMYIPYLFSLFLENNKIQTYFQATTRSPINIDKEISSKISFIDNYGEEIDNFLYNVIDKDYDKIFICYETIKIPDNHKLKEILLSKFNNVEIIYFNDI